MSLKREFKIELDWIRSTKNTEVYGTDSQAAVVNQLYIKKSAFSGEAPDSISITISNVENNDGSNS